MWCRACKTRHGYMTLKMEYEKRGGRWFILWICPKTNNVIGDKGLGGNDKGVGESTERSTGT